MLWVTVFCLWVDFQDFYLLSLSNLLVCLGLSRANTTMRTWITGWPVLIACSQTSQLFHCNALEFPMGPLHALRFLRLCPAPQRFLVT